jgi:hypothetical protein
MTDTALMADLVQLFDSGQTFDDYVSTVPCHRPLWRARSEELALVDIGADLDQAPLVSAPVSALVFAEPWCIDAVLNVPLLNRVAEVEARLAIRLVSFSKHALRSRFTGRGGQPRVPTIVFFETLTARVEYWSERSRRANGWFETFTSERPMPPLLIADDRPATPELDAWMRARFRAESAACGGLLWTATIDEWREILARLQTTDL